MPPPVDIYPFPSFLKLLYLISNFLFSAEWRRPQLDPPFGCLSPRPIPSYSRRRRGKTKERTGSFRRSFSSSSPSFLFLSCDGCQFEWILLLLPSLFLSSSFAPTPFWKISDLFAPLHFRFIFLAPRTADLSQTRFGSTTLPVSEKVKTLDSMGKKTTRQTV